MRYARLLTNSQSFIRVAADKRAGNLSHAYLLVGEDSLAIGSLCRLIAAQIVCGCFECDACRRAIEDLLPDVIVFDDDKVKTEDIDSINEKLILTPFETDFKVYLIPRAHTMTPAAQNKLLKALEEPPSFVVFVLGVTNTTAVLPTVVSRCRIVEVPPFAEGALWTALEPFTDDRVALDTAVATSGGMLTSAHAALNNEKLVDIYQLALTTLSTLTRGRQLPDISRPIIREGRNWFGLFLECVDSILRDAMAISSGRSELVFGSHAEEQIRQIAKLYPLNAMINIKKRMRRVREYLRGNANPAPLVDRLLLIFLEERYKCR